MVGTTRSQVYHTGLFGFRANDDNWRTIMTNCPALPRGAVQKAIEHAGYLYEFTGGRYEDSTHNREVWRAAVPALNVWE